MRGVFGCYSSNGINCTRIVGFLRVASQVIELRRKVHASMQKHV